jgi:hypothetical protein
MLVFDDDVGSTRLHSARVLAMSVSSVRKREEIRSLR